MNSEQFTPKFLSFSKNPDPEKPVKYGPGESGTLSLILVPLFSRLGCTNNMCAHIWNSPHRPGHHGQNTNKSCLEKIQQQAVRMVSGLAGKPLKKGQQSWA
jgi:hypothetical protein